MYSVFLCRYKEIVRTNALSLFSVRVGEDYEYPSNLPCCGRYDGCLAHFHPESPLLAVGRLLHRLHRGGRGGLHDAVGREPRLHFHDQPHHVHRF